MAEKQNSLLTLDQKQQHTTQKDSHELTQANEAKKPKENKTPTNEANTSVDKTRESITTMATPNTTTAGTEISAQSLACNTTQKNLDEFIKTLKPQENKVLQTFLKSPVYDKYMSYLEGVFHEKDTLIHRINCYCLRVKEDCTLRVQGKVYQCKKGQLIYIQKDAFGNACLKNQKLERIM